MVGHATNESAVFYRDFTRPYKTMVRGEGSYLFDDLGKRYLDAAGGVAVNIVGHGERRILDALATHKDEVNYLYGAAFTSPWQEELARDLASISPFEFPGSSSPPVAQKRTKRQSNWRGNIILNEANRSDGRSSLVGRVTTATRWPCWPSRDDRPGGHRTTRIYSMCLTLTRPTATAAPITSHTRRAASNVLMTSNGPFALKGPRRWLPSSRSR